MSRIKSAFQKKKGVAYMTSRERVLGHGGGYIFAPSHAIQAGTPPENIYAFLKATGRLPEIN
jgi:uroporphyrinogen-III decarboxylase